MTTTILVVNIRSGLYTPENCFYIGRAAPGWAGSPLANPFRIVQEHERPKAMWKYKKHLDTLLSNIESDASKEMARIEMLVLHGADEVRLACWCVPKPCHGHVIRGILLKRLADRK